MEVNGREEHDRRSKTERLEAEAVCRRIHGPEGKEAEGHLPAEPDRRSHAARISHERDRSSSRAKPRHREPWEAEQARNGAGLEGKACAQRNGTRHRDASSPSHGTI